MPSRDLDQISTTPSPSRQAEFIGQATAVEQARAVAEVQAAVVVAQQVPRDMGRAIADMRDACGRLGLAGRAFYSVPNRGSGPSVHLARELVRIWGNADYGVHELRRDDQAGISEIRAFAWDQQTNVRSSRTFIVPHAKDTRQGRKVLTDLADIYLNNHNIGARAVRESIFTILPAWFVDEAVDLCRVTMEKGEGKPLTQRVDDIVAAFAAIDVKVTQLEERVGRGRGSWTPADLAELTILGASIKRGEVTKAEAFPQRRVSADEITGQLASAPSAPTTGEYAPPPSGEAPAPGEDPWAEPAGGAS